jgi:hypothetical protein
MTKAVMNGDHMQAVNFLSLGTLAVPGASVPTTTSCRCSTRSASPAPGGQVRTFNEGFQWPCISMRGFVLT